MMAYVRNKLGIGSKLAPTLHKTLKAPLEENLEQHVKDEGETRVRFVRDEGRFHERSSLTH